MQLFLLRANSAQVIPMTALVGPGFSGLRMPVNKKRLVRPGG